MQIVTVIASALGILLFCGFMSVFMLPTLFFWIFYTIPQIIRFSLRKKIRFQAMYPVLRKVGAWVLIILVLYAIAFLTDVKTGMALLSSPTADISWGISACIILWTLFFNRESLQREFYMDIYLKYIYPSEREKYDAYILAVGKYTLQTAAEEQKKQLPYLYKVAVRNRIHFIKNENSALQKNIDRQKETL